MQPASGGNDNVLPVQRRHARMPGARVEVAQLTQHRGQCLEASFVTGRVLGWLVGFEPQVAELLDSSLRRARQGAAGSGRGAGVSVPSETLAHVRLVSPSVMLIQPGVSRRDAGVHRVTIGGDTVCSILRRSYH
jgi:hypothetical protein